MTDIKLILVKQVTHFIIWWVVLTINPIGMVYGQSSQISRDGLNKNTTTSHFNPIVAEPSHSPIKISIYSAKIESVELQSGDEIGIFNGDVCIGAIRLRLDQLFPKTLLISKDNSVTSEIDGFTNISELQFRLWDSNESTELINVNVKFIRKLKRIISLNNSISVKLSVNKIFGCTDRNAQNYHNTATIEDGSCIGSTHGCVDINACNYSTGTTVIMDTCLYNDCIGECGGEAILDDCSQCSRGNSGHPENSDQDCNGRCFGSAFLNSCGNCVEGDTGLSADLGKDCAGDCNGTAYETDCGCVGGSTGADPGYCYGCTDPASPIFSPYALHDDGACEDYVTDVDGNTYKYTIIGDQTWMTQNLRVSRYRNGDPISTGYSDSEWVMLEAGAYSVYNNEPVLLEYFGNLYNWYAIDDDRGICPEGWHVPDDEEWQQLVVFLGGPNFAGDKLKSNGTPKIGSLWKISASNITNESGFTAFPGGYRASTSGAYSNRGKYAYFWTSSDDADYGVWIRKLHYNFSGVSRISYNKQPGFSVRCIQQPK